MTDSNSPDPDFDWLANVYSSHSAINHPSELHGLMIGELAAGSRKNPDEWIVMVLDHMGIEELNTIRQTHLVPDLIDFYQKTDQEIEQDSSAFDLLLPDDDYDLSDRVESLTVWVRGFLEGLAIALGEKLNNVDSELQEIMRDFVEICQLDARVGTEESAEKEFFEICEFVRVGVLNLYAEFNQPSAHQLDEGSSGSPTLH